MVAVDWSTKQPGGRGDTTPAWSMLRSWNECDRLLSVGVSVGRVFSQPRGLRPLPALNQDYCIGPLRLEGRELTSAGITKRVRREVKVVSGAAYLSIDGIQNDLELSLQSPHRCMWTQPKVVPICQYYALSTGFKGDEIQVFGMEGIRVALEIETRLFAATL